MKDNDAVEILAATEELVLELMDRNALAPEQMVSCIFTLTDDLDAEFPAVAARRLGLSAVPLLCAREVAVPGALPRVLCGPGHRASPRVPARGGHAPA